MLLFMSNKELDIYGGFLPAVPLSPNNSSFRFVLKIKALRTLILCPATALSLIRCHNCSTKRFGQQRFLVAKFREHSLGEILGKK